MDEIKLHPSPFFGFKNMKKIFPLFLLFLFLIGSLFSETIVVENYTFNKATKQITFTDYASIKLESIEQIVCLKNGRVLFRAGQPDLSGTVSTNVLTLLYDTNISEFSNDDKLQIKYDESNLAVASSKLSQAIWRASFPDVGAGVLSTKFSKISDGYWNGSAMVTGATVVAQSAGNLTIASSAVANDEVILRSQENGTAKYWSGAFTARWKTILSQRIVNNNFYVLLADQIGLNLAFTSANATSVVVTIPSNPFTSANVGQSMELCGIVTATGASAPVPMRAAIASVSGNDVTFTVAGWPAGGSTGTLNLIGWNYIRTLYTGATATNAAFDAQRQGWNTGDSTVTVNTTATGHVGQVYIDNSQVSFGDGLVTSNTSGTNQFTSRANRIDNIPDDSANLHVFLISRNGTTNPASTTTWTVGFTQVEKWNRLPVTLSGLYGNDATAIPINVRNTTLTTVAQVRNTQGGLGSMGATALSANPSAVNTGRNVDMISDLIGRLIVTVGGIPSLQLPNRVVLSSTTETTMIAAVASNRSIIYDVVVANLSAANSVQVDFRDTTAGTIRKTVNLAANSSIHISLPAGWVQQAVNTNWTVQATGTTPSVAISTSHFAMPY